MKIVEFTKDIFNKSVFELKKHSPEILMGAGIIGCVASTIIACKETTKLNDILTDSKEQIDTIHAAVDNPDSLGKGVKIALEKEGYSKEDAKKDLTIVYVQTGMKLIKNYAPSVALGAISIVSILFSHNIMTKRAAALAAAYATVSKTFKEYRSRVVKRFGEDLDRELRYNIKTREVEETIEKEDGTTETIKKTIEEIDPSAIGDYSKFFDEYSNQWTKDSEYNFMFLKQTQNWANEVLKSRKYIFLNEIYEALGIPQTRAGSQVGWVYDENNPVGDNYVDFGIFDGASDVKRAFVNGYERSILLDFNPDGDIWDLIS